jgi:hypothetical protein
MNTIHLMLFVAFSIITIVWCLFAMRYMITDSPIYKGEEK